MILLGLPVLLASSAACSVITGTKTYQLASPAMEPTLKRGASVTAQTVDPGDYQPAVGDIVVLDPPDTWSPANADIRSIFRVVAVPGDTIGCCDAQGRITRNGTAVDEPYVQARTRAAAVRARHPGAGRDLSARRQPRCRRGLQRARPGPGGQRDRRGRGLSRPPTVTAGSGRAELPWAR